jgi:hypothetical protein
MGKVTAKQRLKELKEYLQQGADLEPEEVSLWADVLSETTPNRTTRYKASRHLKRMAYALRLLRGDFD